MSRVSRLVPVLVASALVFAACGSDDSSSDATSDATDAPATTTAATTADTEPAATEPPATEPASTEPMTTEPAATEVPATEVPATEVPDTEAPSAGSIIDVATAAGNLTTLLAAVDAAGLTEDLATTKYTLLAPSDEAFAALDPATLDALLADPAALTALLQNHLLPLDQDAHSIGIFQKVVTVAGNPLAVTKDGETVTVGGATIVQPDLVADNGYVHVIDTVLVPAPAV